MLLRVASAVAYASSTAESAALSSPLNRSKSAWSLTASASSLSEPTSRASCTERADKVSACSSSQTSMAVR